MDVTGDARYSEERDRVRATLKHLQAYGGGMLWDASTSTLTIQMTTTEDALQQARLLLLVTSPTWLRVMFVQVQYSALELRELAARLLELQTAWGRRLGHRRSEFGLSLVLTLSQVRRFRPSDTPILSTTRTGRLKSAIRIAPI
ncbi:hypothetical protein AB0E63_34430 [Kribbella sp. NPDC026596]|uniref:hypothetical protein n=1 Tax=Kribbella sp. NPDC026596 TaxID=3155122 RepID=UPI0033FC0641